MTANTDNMPFPADWKATIQNSDELHQFRQGHIDHGGFAYDKVFQIYDDLSKEEVYEKCEEIDPLVWTIIGGLNRFLKCSCGQFRKIKYNEEKEWQIKNLIVRWLPHHFPRLKEFEQL